MIPFILTWSSGLRRLIKLIYQLRRIFFPRLTLILDTVVQIFVFTNYQPSWLSSLYFRKSQRLHLRVNLLLIFFLTLFLCYWALIDDNGIRVGILWEYSIIFNFLRDWEIPEIPTFYWYWHLRSGNISSLKLTRSGGLQAKERRRRITLLVFHFSQRYRLRPSWGKLRRPLM